MKISIITVFPELYDNFLATSILARAIEHKQIEINRVRLSDFVQSKERIDEPTCGPGPGMILKPEVIEKAILACEQTWGVGYRIFFSPQGVVLNQKLVRYIAQKFTNSAKSPDVAVSTAISEHDHIILVCSRYEGIDERVIQKYADLELSIGDYVLFGGDLPAQVLIESLVRLIPGVVGTQESVEHESFSGCFLDHPQYGLPVSWHDLSVPDIILSGNHAKIAQWRQELAAKKTVNTRFDWFRSSEPQAQERALAYRMIPNHYVAVMHTQVLMKDGSVGQTSVASLDIHDIARSARTYGLKEFFVVCPLQDQQEILGTFLNFWRSPEGIDYNKSRHDAVELVTIIKSFDDVCQKIEQKEGKKPIVIATSARSVSQIPVLDYYSQSIAWKHERPVLLLFGTGWGLCNELLDACDYVLAPVQGLSEYNHLSVRAAASIVFDRWLGLNPKKLLGINKNLY